MLQPPPGSETAVQRLLLRELVTAVPAGTAVSDGVTFNIELVRRWFDSREP